MIPRHLREQIVNKILVEVTPQKIVLFGSQVREDNRKGSDIDIALFGVEEKKAFPLGTRLNEEVDTLRDIEVVLFEKIKNKTLKEKILKEGVVIYERSHQ